MLKPLFDPSLSSVVVRTDRHHGKETVVGVQKAATSRATAMVFEDPASVSLRADLMRLAPTDATILVIGETGTGKELVARYLHAHSRRKSGRFLAVNCGALSETLLEAELFGHEKGAFTGALKREPGWFEAANGGTLLLDEIGDLPLSAQVKLLRVLQEREIVRVGSREAIPIDVRLIAATNVDLSAAVHAQIFREDLYYRLNVAKVKLAPLRHRKGDIEPLAQYFLRYYGARLERNNLELSSTAIDYLRNYSWPGNIRELENVIHSAILLSESDLVTDVPISSGIQIAERSTGPGLESLVRTAVTDALRTNEPDVFSRVTGAMISTAYEMTNRNQSRSAESLGLSRNEFRTQLAKIGVISPRKSISPENPSRGPGISAKILDSEELRIGYQKFGTLNLIKASGRLEQRLHKEGLCVKWREYQSGIQLLEALARGDVDFGATGEIPPLFAQSLGWDFCYVGYEPPMPTGVAIIVERSSPFHSVKDLHGKKVAVTNWSNAHYFLTKALAANGMTLKDVAPVYRQPSASLIKQLIDDEIHAWATWEPFPSLQECTEHTRVLTDGRNLVSNHLFYVARRSLMYSNPHYASLIFDEISRASSLFSRLGSNDVDLLHKSIPDDMLENYKKMLVFSPTPINRSVISEQQAIADAYYSAGELPSRVKVEQAVWSC